MTDLAACGRGYFESVRACDAAAVAARFAEAGLIHLPDGETIVGRRAIEAFYTKVFAATAPNPRILAIAVDGQKCLVELLAHRPDGSASQVADVFTFDTDGQVLELSIYMRSGLIRPS